jgi:hypothetical protein
MASLLSVIGYTHPYLFHSKLPSYNQVESMSMLIWFDMLSFP